MLRVTLRKDAAVMNTYHVNVENTTSSHEFGLTPVLHYNPPAYPTRAAKPAYILKKLPVRWAKNSAIIACVGALSLGALTGCDVQVAQTAERCGDGTHGVGAIAASPQTGDWYAENGREYDVEVRAHWGGSGAGPFYVAYLTEQEALGIIRNRLCEAGICFDAPVPNYVATAETPWSEATATLALYDERTGLGIVFPATWWDEFRWGISHEQIEGALRQDFAQRFNIPAIFMQNPGEGVGEGNWWEGDVQPPTDEEAREAGPILESKLLASVDTFIAQLRSEGILPSTQSGEETGAIEGTDS